ncbi:hypothetical protein A2316_04270 [Candidatus Falkowbacteria bacterium RIFOXYB2_FULL_38_15]|uniref:Uncharacterized protein n=1 Tax=Candidatus Falkowbacteria bacterium RIFOXYA2_FULL_38_12 TaxID=1797993 RepID=A0A1F5S4A8_9BACT|nr:MAG: hypothetical protein A2257_01190 [Candidatus Falkowbacteria bacterium RIFOXYA2_FULL_38_12]OGF33708.1 MAG: hypothetical protein A2316_04270 [Candidatus Falkowbacteria bacterium RIFOXYB2_FULL_38_15]OGF42281.1 MAG: hypothetical protein A2555_04300 [Candidatus Falkowbacteria bacterium RIFOXYD2_FULL_39_16]
MYYYTRKNAFGQIKFSILGLSHLFFVSPLSVIPAQAGIYFFRRVDPRLRGNDRLKNHISKIPSSFSSPKSIFIF